jgi:hypothetical protein
LFVKIIFIDTDGIPLLVAFLCDTQSAAFDRQAAKLLIGGVYGQLRCRWRIILKNILLKGDFRQ